MTIENNLLGTHSFVVHNERYSRITVCIKSGFIGGNSFTRAVAAIIEKQNIESVFGKALAHPANIRDVAAVAVKEDDGGSRRCQFTFEKPAVQASTVSGVEPNNLRALRRRLALLGRHSCGTERHQRLQPSQSEHEGHASHDERQCE